MNSRERVLCSLSWQEPDRVPIQTYLTGEIEERLRAHFKRLRLESISSVEGTTNLSYVFGGVSTGSWEDFQKELRSEVPYHKMNVFFSRPSPVS